MSEQANWVINLLEFDTADRMRRSLRISDVTVQDMADYLDVQRNTVGRWINGHVEPSKQTLRLWALRTGVPLEWLETGRVAESPRPDPDGGELCAILDSNQEPIDLESADSGDSSVIDFAARRRAAETAPGTSDDDERKAA